MGLDDIKIYKKLDKNNCYQSIELLPNQIKQVIDDSSLIKVPPQYSATQNIVVGGMGGSNIGAYIIKYALFDKLKAPIIINPGYLVPKFVNSKTLYILSSYSGTTEEPLSTYLKLKKRSALILAQTASQKGNVLEKLMIKDDIPGYIFKPQYNPSNQPRLGLGYSVCGLISLLKKIKLLDLSNFEMLKIVKFLEINNQKLKPEEPTAINVAKQIALKLANKIPTFVAGEFLIGNIIALRNQMSENSKTLPNFLDLPDLNHFAMEGLGFPKSRQKNTVFLFFNSSLYTKKIQKRSNLTQTIVEKNKIPVISYELKGKTSLEQNFELLQLGTWITYYLGMINRINPGDIPWVNWFKSQL